MHPRWDLKSVVGVLFILALAQPVGGNPISPFNTTSRYLPSGIAIPPLHVALNGADSGDCSSLSPCATLLYAVAAVAAFQYPLDGPVPIMLGPGLYSASSCGVSASRPLAIIGSGSGNTVVDCGRAQPFLSTTSSISISSMTIANGLSTGDGGAVAVQYSGTGTSLSVSFTDVSIVNCTASGNGGSIFIDTLSDVGTVLAFHGVSVLNSTAGQSGVCVCVVVVVCIRMCPCHCICVCLRHCVSLSVSARARCSCVCV